MMQLTKDANRRMTWLLLAWIALGMLVAEFTEAADLVFDQCELCLALEAHLPAIQVLRLHADTPRGVVFAASFFAVADVFLIVSLLVFVRDYDAITPEFGAIAVLVVFVVGLGAICFLGIDPPRSGRLSRTYWRNEMFAVFVHGCLWLLPSVCLVSLLHVCLPRHITRITVGERREEHASD